MIAAVAGLVPALAFLLLYIVCRRHDRRMLRNGGFLTAAILFGAAAAVSLLTAVVPGFGFIVGLAVLLVPLALIALGIALLVNGVQMLRREGRSLGNLLSLVAGVLVFVLPTTAIVVFAVATSGRQNAVETVSVAAVVLLVFLCVYVALAFVAFVAFAVYSVVYGRMRFRETPDAIVVLGSGLIRGEVPPLLRSRLDRALVLYRSEVAAGRRPALIPSGGQGTTNRGARARRWPGTCSPTVRTPRTCCPRPRLGPPGRTCASRARCRRRPG